MCALRPRHIIELHPVCNPPPPVIGSFVSIMLLERLMGPTRMEYWGNPIFITTANAVSQNGMANPRGMAFQETTLFVADNNNHRVLRFDNAARKAPGANADGVLGQPDFISKTPSLTQTGMVLPGRVAVDQGGRLYVSEGLGARRVLIYTDAASKINGGQADFVIGQPDFQYPEWSHHSK